MPHPRIPGARGIVPAPSQPRARVGTLYRSRTRTGEGPEGLDNSEQHPVGKGARGVPGGGVRGDRGGGVEAGAGGDRRHAEAEAERLAGRPSDPID
jgi:hypothetical protein